MPKIKPMTSQIWGAVLGGCPSLWYIFILTSSMASEIRAAVAPPHPQPRLRLERSIGKKDVSPVWWHPRSSAVANRTDMEPPRHRPSRTPRILNSPTTSPPATTSSAVCQQPATDHHVQPRSAATVCREHHNMEIPDPPASPSSSPPVFNVPFVVRGCHVQSRSGTPASQSRRLLRRPPSIVNSIPVGGPILLFISGIFQISLGTGHENICMDNDT